MAEKTNQQLSTFAVDCGDATSGRISADSKEKARAMAAEMCKVHGGTQGEPQERSQFE